MAVAICASTRSSAGNASYGSRGFFGGFARASWRRSLLLRLSFAALTAPVLPASSAPAHDSESPPRALPSSYGRWRARISCPHDRHPQTRKVLRRAHALRRRVAQARFGRAVWTCWRERIGEDDVPRDRRGGRTGDRRLG